MGISWESHGIFMGYQKMEDWWLICSCFCPTGVAKKTIQKNIHKHHGMWLVIPHFWTTSGSHFSVDPLLSHTEIGYIGHLSVPKKKLAYGSTIPYLIVSQYFWLSMRKILLFVHLCCTLLWQTGAPNNKPSPSLMGWWAVQTNPTWRFISI